MRQRFVNPHIRNIRRSIKDIIIWTLGRYARSHFKHMPSAFVYPSAPEPLDPHKPLLTWIGHSTFFIHAHDLSLITDPMFGKHCSPIPIKMMRREHPLVVSLDQLPRLDVALISHNHYDHLDKKSVIAINRKNPEMRWIVPEGLKKWFNARGIHRVVELRWYESIQISKDCTVTAVPAQHFSNRTFFDMNRTHWCGFVCKIKEKTFYFTGDTGYNHFDFKEIGNRFDQIDLSMIPIGAYLPRPIMQPVHINPREAVAIHRDVRSKKSVGMHWKTFHLSTEEINQPPYDLFLAMQESSLPFQSFIPMQVGQTINW